MIQTSDAMRAKKSLEEYLTDKTSTGFVMPGIVGAMSRHVGHEVKHERSALRRKLDSVVRIAKRLAE